MIKQIIELIADSTKTLITMLVSLLFGQSVSAFDHFAGPQIMAVVSNPVRYEMLNMSLQWAAWLVAIIAGLCAIVNYFVPLNIIYKNHQERKKRKKLEKVKK